MSRAEQRRQRLWRLLRQWEAADKLSANALQRALDDMTRLDYLADEQLALLGCTNQEALSLSRAKLHRQCSAACEELQRLQAQMWELLHDLEDLEVPPQHLVERGRKDLSREVIPSLRLELELRESLLQCLPELRTSPEQERQRLWLVWTERPYSSVQEGAALPQLMESLRP